MANPGMATTNITARMRMVAPGQRPGESSPRPREPGSVLCCEVPLPPEPPMAVPMTCECGSSYDLKDEFAGKLVKCPHCGRPARAPSVATAVADADPAFDRDIFLLRQQMLKISEKYDVGDEQGNKVVFVERPAHFLRNFGAVLAAFGVVMLAVWLMGTVGDSAAPGSPLRTALALVSLLLVFVGAPAVGIALSVKRHVSFYRDE